MSIKFVKPERVPLKNQPELNEKWVQERIADDPSLLGLGDLILRDRERIQPRAGRLDLLFQDAESDHRYEVEIQLGQTDESHIIRTIEYWDIERKRYPQYDHTAVLVAEDVTSRFLNVVSLFNGYIPLVAIQMQALKFGEQFSLVFTTVLSEMRLGPDEGEEEKEITDRAYWEKRASKATLAMADKLFQTIKSWDSELVLRYDKFKIGLTKNGQKNNFVIFKPKKRWLRAEPRLERSEEIDAKLEEAGLDIMDYSKSGRYRIKLNAGDIKKYQGLLHELLRMAYEKARD